MVREFPGSPPSPSPEGRGKLAYFALAGGGFLPGSLIGGRFFGGSFTGACLLPFAFVPIVGFPYRTTFAVCTRRARLRMRPRSFALDAYFAFTPSITPP